MTLIVLLILTTIPEDDAGIAQLLREKFTKDVALPGGNATNTSKVFELNNAFVQCDVCTLDNNLNNEYVKHLLEGKGLPITLYNFILLNHNQ